MGQPFYPVIIHQQASLEMTRYILFEGKEAEKM
jgi:hypothetical protein